MTAGCFTLPWGFAERGLGGSLGHCQVNGPCWGTQKITDVGTPQKQHSHMFRIDVTMCCV